MTQVYDMVRQGIARDELCQKGILQEVKGVKACDIN